MRHLHRSQEAIIGPTLADSVNRWPAKRQPLRKEPPENAGRFFRGTGGVVSRQPQAKNDKNQLGIEGLCDFLGVEDRSPDLTWIRINNFFSWRFPERKLC